jgi:hypothetical protein
LSITVKKMKLIILFLWVTSIWVPSNAQLTDYKIDIYAKQISQRNAHLLNCDTLAPSFQVVYHGLLKDIQYFRSGENNSVRRKSLFASFQVAERDICKLLNRKKRKLFKALIHAKGNVFLW